MQRRKYRVWSRIAPYRARVLALALFAITTAGIQGGCRAEQPWPLWQHYKAGFLDASGRIIDHNSGDRTTSEGQAYGMFFALVANDRPAFDRMLQWTEDNLAGGDLTARLPAWSWGRLPNNEWKTIDESSASDADLWLAYDCLEAGRLWKDNRIEKLGEVLADEIAHRETATVPGLGTVLVPGPVGFHLKNGYVLNPSYLPPQVLARMREMDPAGPWSALEKSLPSLLAQGSPSGYAMDWILAGNTVQPSPSPQQLAQGKADARAIGSYEAIRVYLWLGMADKGTAGLDESLRAVSGMARYLAQNGVPPAEVDDTGKVLNPTGSVGFSAAVYPYLLTLGKSAEAGSQKKRLDASLDASTGLYGKTPAYYDQNLALFATGWKEQRFQFDRNGRLKLRWP